MHYFFSAVAWLEEGPFALYHWEELAKVWPLFAKAFLYTIGISIGALVLSILLGILFGGMSATKSKVARGITRVYVEFFQNTPLLIQFVVVYYGLPMLNPHLMLPTSAVGILCVGLYHGAYISEVVRSGIEAVSRGQREAAYSQGFTYWQTMFYVILPQAWRMMLPPLTNQIVNLIKNTSTIALIAGVDIMFVADDWAATTASYVPAFTVAGLMYFVLCFPLAKLARKLEEDTKKAYTR